MTDEVSAEIARVFGEQPANLTGVAKLYSDDVAPARRACDEAMAEVDKLIAEEQANPPAVKRYFGAPRKADV